MFNIFRLQNYYQKSVHTLNHKVLDDAVKCGSLVALWYTILAVFPCAQLTKVLSCLWHYVCK